MMPWKSRFITRWAGFRNRNRPIVSARQGYRETGITNLTLSLDTNASGLQVSYLGCRPNPRAFRSLRGNFVGETGFEPIDPPLPKAGVRKQKPRPTGIPNDQGKGINARSNVDRDRRGSGGSTPTRLAPTRVTGRIILSNRQLPMIYSLDEDQLQLIAGHT